MLDIKAWNYWVWSAFNNKIYNLCFNNDDIINEESTEFYEKVIRVEENQTVEYEIEEKFRECIRIKKKGKIYLMPVLYSKQMPLTINSSFKCQIKMSDKKIYHFVTEVTSQNITETEPKKDLQYFIKTWNPVEHTEPKYYEFIKMLTIASIIKPLKVALCSEPNTGKNSNWTIVGKMFNNVGRFGTPTLAVFERSLYYNHVTIIDEITSVAPAQMRELEPVILTISDNSPDYKKHSLAQQSFLNNVDLGETSLIFPFNRKIDIEFGGKFFDDVWNNPSAFKSRVPHIMVKGEVITLMPQLSKPESIRIMKDNFDGMRLVVKELVYWKKNLHKHIKPYTVNIKLSNRHMTNLQSLIDVMNVCSDTQEIFNEWCKFLFNSISDYKTQEEQSEDEVSI